MEKYGDEARVTPELIEYIRTNVFPVYAKNDQAHQLEHIEYVIRRSLLFMQQFDGLNADMVYAIAAYHDIAHHVDKDNHETLSASMFEADMSMKRFFTDDQRQIMKEAIEDHRASLEYEPRSRYGKIVSSADRSVDVDAFLRRTHAYSLKHFPGFTEAQNMERCYQHMKDKYGSSGYAKHYVVDEEYLQFQQIIRNLIEDRNAFEEKYRAVNVSADTF